MRLPGKSWCWRAGLLGIALTAACDSPPMTLYPLSETPEARRFEPGLVGAWSSTEEDGEWLFLRRAGYHRYEVTIHGPDTNLVFAAYLVPFGSDGMLDLFPMHDFNAGDHLLQPVHLVFRVWLEGNTMWYGYAAGDRWIEELERQRQQPVVKLPDGGLLVASSTDQLRALIVAMLADSTTDWHATALVRTGDSPRQPPPEDAVQPERQRERQ